MGQEPPRDRPVRVLLTEGSSTSAREAITALALAGHAVSFCDPEPVCLGRFSRLVAGRYRCPPLGADPLGYRAFVLDLLATGRFDVLLPIHEQGYLFARIAGEVRRHAALALPSFESYARMQGKAGLRGLLAELGLPHPRTEVIEDRRVLAGFDAYPYVLKTDLGTASRGTWLVRDASDHARALEEISAADPSGGAVLVQDWVEAPLEQAQAVFRHGRLVGFHATRRLIEGAGGGAALKESVRRPRVADDMARIGAHLAWHGALSLDYFLDREAPLYIDANPRLVEPMAACLAGVNLADLLVRVSLGAHVDEGSESRAGLRSRLALQALLGTALRHPSRRALLRTCRDLLAREGAFAEAAEELSPARLDPPSAVPVIGAGLALFLRPHRAAALARRGWGRHLLTPEAARLIEGLR
ncbi:ATP-grasp domain-containing protein [Methylobacterium oxalidis]|uniref:ATP-grasp domain-containing protein n=1 Tax=Methylobacterium oxalidis TaxID=944322 RepID=UPI003315FCAF